MASAIASPRAAPAAAPLALDLGLLFDHPTAGNGGPGPFAGPMLPGILGNGTAAAPLRSVPAALPSPAPAAAPHVADYVDPLVLAQPVSAPSAAQPFFGPTFGGSHDARPSPQPVSMVPCPIPIRRSASGSGSWGTVSGQTGPVTDAERTAAAMDKGLSDIQIALQFKEMALQARAAGSPTEFLQHAQRAQQYFGEASKAFSKAFVRESAHDSRLAAALQKQLAWVTEETVQLLLQLQDVLRSDALTPRGDAPRPDSFKSDSTWETPSFHRDTSAFSATHSVPEPATPRATVGIPIGIPVAQPFASTSSSADEVFDATSDMLGPYTRVTDEGDAPSDLADAASRANPFTAEMHSLKLRLLEVTNKRQSALESAPLLPYEAESVDALFGETKSDPLTSASFGKNMMAMALQTPVTSALLPPPIPPRRQHATTSTDAFSQTVHHSQAAMPLLPSASGSPADPTPAQPARRTLRAMEVEELITTEVTYVTNLQTIMECYYSPLTRAPDPILTADQARVIFGNISDIVALHQVFLEELQRAARAVVSDFKLEDACVGGVFVRLAQFFNMYKPYCNNFEASTKLIAELMQSNPRFADHLQAALMDPRVARQSLQSFLIMPVQRIPRYELLLHSLRKATDAGHPDAPAIDKALEAVHNVATRINATMSESERRLVLYDLSFRFRPMFNLVEPARRFVMDGDLKKLCRVGWRKYHFFLFSDVMVYGSPQPLSQYLTFHRLINLVAVRPHDSSEQPYCFEVIGREKSFVVSCDAADQQRTWMTALQSVLDELRGKPGTVRVRSDKDKQHDTTSPEGAPILRTSMKTPKACAICNESFGWLSRKKASCPMCGRLVCSECIAPAVSPKPSQPELRMCSACFGERASRRGLYQSPIKSNHARRATML